MAVQRRRPARRAAAALGAPAAAALLALLVLAQASGSAAAETAAPTPPPRRRALHQAAPPPPASAAAAAAQGAAGPVEGGLPALEFPDPEPDEEGEDGGGGKASIPATTMPPCCKGLPPGFPAPGIPVVIVDTEGAVLQPHKAKVPGKLCTCGAPGGLDYEVPARVRIRGSSSAEHQQQKSLAVDSRHPRNASRKGEIEFMGFPAHDEWILYAPEGDPALGLRNWLAYGASRRMGRYASRTRYVEVFLVQDRRPLSREHYWGLYIAGEAVARGRERVDVKKFRPERDVSGGWMLAYENDNTKGDYFFDTAASRLTFLVTYPKATQDQLLWIKNFVDGMESALIAGNATAVAERLDVAAAVDYFLGTELTKNPDGYRGSIKLHKDRGGPLVMGPMWDYDEAFGECCGYPIEGWKGDGSSNGTSGGSAISPEGWRFNVCNEPQRCKVEPLDGVSQWYRRLWLDGDFRAAAARRWAQLRQERLADAWFTAEVAQAGHDAAHEGAGRALLGCALDRWRVRTAIANATDRNFERWRGALANPQFPGGWRQQWDAAAAALQNWLLAHLAWMDGAFAKLAAPGAGPDAYLHPAPAPAPAPAAAGGAANDAGLQAAAVPAPAASG
ncbi:hypothetical protein Rsub_11876 [Raphidocelis subcapitata]|uniref:Spore coat protein CotH n=1 Tax=Raphidocelis subcapitata TaxID=307507 RepID=A0A2V0PFI1_9CHLO|nr:hypothetical protein Rsub_11876 [Raphidocelis subcapitata]|eukprot:GBF98546.1 hypothetical protein Rsub_11876 [Raphidocelis subcapitata]